MPRYISSLYLYKFVFIFALTIAETLLFFRLPKKDKYTLRATGGILCSLAIAAIYPVAENNALSISLMFAVFFIFSLFLAKWCYDISWNSCLFCTVAGYSIQHMASILYNIVITMFGAGRISNPYSTESAQVNLFVVLIFIECYVLVYHFLYFVFVRRIDKNEDVKITNPVLLGIMVLMMSVEILINAFVLNRQNYQFDTVYFLCASVTNLLCSFCILTILFGQLLRKNLENELAVVNQLRRQEKQQYEFSRETIDMINIKCHDMRHHIREIRHSGKISNASLKEVEKSIDIYDSILKTGCSALDVILAEKSLFCQKNNISVNCIVDGEKLSFMSDSDIYSLFGNLLDNAIRSVMKLEEGSRTISLSVKARGQLLSVNIHNPYKGEIHLENGLPQTDQDNRNEHGFGVRSISMIAQKYGGTVTFNLENHIFNANLLFPLKSR